MAQITTAAEAMQLFKELFDRLREESRDPHLRPAVLKMLDALEIEVARLRKANALRLLH